jgi:hypothetical protein
MKHVSFDFLRLSDSPLANVGLDVATKLTDNPHFPNPIITPAALTTACELFQTRIQAALGGGPLDVALKNESRLDVEDKLRQLAVYVQAVANGDVAKILSVGFRVVSSNRARTQLPQPVILRIFSPVSTVLAVRVARIANARAWEVRVRNGAEEWHTFGGLTSSRMLLVPNRVPGQTYTIQVRAIGGLTGYSDWSDSVSHMAI